MKKGIKYFLNILVIILAVFFVVMQSIELFSTLNTFQWDDLILIIIVVVIIIILSVLLGLIYRFIYCKISKLINKKQYELAIQKAISFNKFILNNFIRQKYAFEIVLLYVILSDEVNYNLYLEKINHKKLLTTKYFWQTISEIKFNNIDNARAVYTQFCNSSKQMIKGYVNYSICETLLSGFISFYDKDYLNAKEKITSVISNFNHVLINPLCDGILAEIDKQIQ